MFEKYKYSSRRAKPARILFMVLLFIAVAGALSWLVMILWNNILTEVTNVKPLNFWKAAGLLLLAKILFGGFKRKSHSYNSHRKSEWRHKWMHMSKEERKEMKSKWKEHCRHRGVHRFEEE